MKCERCHKAEATKALAVEVDGQPSTVFVCAECAAQETSARAKRKGGGTPPVAPEGGVDVAAAQSQGMPSIADMLLDMAKMVSGKKGGAKPPVFEFHVRDGEGPVAMGGDEAQGESEDGDGVLRCPECNMTLEELRDGRHFGCPKCYDVFRDEVLVFTRELQYDDHHVGMRPMRVMIGLELHQLKVLYRKAIARQNYREADELAERIRDLGGTTEDMPGERGDEK